MPATFFANSFRNPLGDGLTSPENDGDGFYVAFGFDEPNPDIGGSHHLGTDWNGEGGGNTDLGSPVYAIGNGTVVAIVSDQGSATTGFGNYIVLRHDLPEPTLINGQWVTQVHSLYAHLDTTASFSVGQQVGIGSQIGTLGMSGYADVAHLHLEITIGGVLPTDDDGYNPSGAQSGWVDPVAFVSERLTPAAPTTSTDMLTAARFALAAYNLAGNENPQSGADLSNAAAAAQYSDLEGEGWRYLTSSESGLTTLNSGAAGERAGFFVVGNAAALVAVRDNTLVLSFRGTNDTGLTPGTDHWDWVHRDVHFNNFADAFLDQLRGYLGAHSEITEVLVTGHSLGAAMVDALFMSSWDLRNLRPGSLDVVGINFADPGYQLGSDSGAAASDLTTFNFNEDVINFASNFSDLAGDFTRILTPDSGTSWTTYHSMQGYLSLVTYLTDLGITADQVNAFAGTFFVNGVVAPSGQAFIVAQYGSRINPTGDQNNFFVGGLGSDEIYGGAYSDTLIGGGGNDDLRGLDSADLLRGSDGDDVLYGGLSHDHLWGENDNDIVRGESGNDFLYGGDGSDNLMGDGGLDRLDGGSGTDRLAGGTGADVFAFADGDFPLFQSVNPDRITDYNRGTGTYAVAEGDLIDLSGINFATSNGSGSTSTVRLRSIEASGGLPAGAILEINIGDDIWRGIARLDGVAAGEAVRIALTDAQSAAGTGSTFVVDGVGNGTTWSISPATRNVAEGNVTISFTITRSGTNLGPETVYVSTTQTQGFYNDGDYVGRLNVPVVFVAGDTSETFTVRINADAVPEGNESFGVIVQSDPQDPLSTFLTSARFTIQDGAPPTVSGSNYVGDELDNVWSGTSSNDIAFGMAGNDRLTGSGGNDILAGSDGDDSLYGGSGNDVILTGDGVNYVDAGSGNDVIDARQNDYAQGTILAGIGDDTIFVGSGNSGGSEVVVSVDGGSGTDLLVVEARDWNSGSYPGNSVAIITHQFSNGDLLDVSSSFAEIESGIASGGDHNVSTAAFYWYSGIYESWINVRNVEHFEYRGQDNNDLFLSWGNNMRVALGGAGTDALYADWSTTTAAIVWNVTVNNDVQRTLGNGVVVQSIERLMLKTGSGNDNLIMGDQDDHVETGAGNDNIVTGAGTNYVDAGSGNDVIDARQNDYAQGTILAGIGDDTIFVGSGNSGGSEVVVSVDGGSGTDLLVVEARDWNSGSYPGNSVAIITHQFSNGDLLDVSSSFAEIESGIASGGDHNVSTAAFYWYSGIYESWINVRNVEHFEYRGQDNNDLFLSWGNNMRVALGGAGTDALYADWSTTTAAIVWNVTVNNDVQRTLGNGVVVQSIERLMLKTGSGNDNLIMGDQDDHVETGAGNDNIVTGAGTNYVDAGSGNDVIDARQNDYAQGTILAGIGDDTIFVGSGNSGGSEVVVSVDGGSGTDLLVVEARDWNSGSYPGNSVAIITHQFSNGDLLDVSSSFAEIESGIASGGDHNVSTAAFYWYSGIYESWINVRNVEHFEYRGQDNNDLFLSWGNNMRVALGGAGTDALYADWSTTTAAIVWNVTVNNDVQRTLGNGVVVQSIERLMLKTGSGNDNLIMGDQDDHVETGAGNDNIVTGAGTNYVDAGSGNDVIDARQNDYAQGTILAGIGDDTIFVGSGNSGGSEVVVSVDGGSGTDLLVVEARDWNSGSYPGNSVAIITHQFSNGDLLDVSSSFAEIESGIASGGDHNVSTAAFYWYSGIYESWINVRNVEHFEYRGQDNNDLFLSWGNNMRVALGGAGTDALYADWSTTTAAIVWNVTVNNDVQRTLGNGVVVQSIERLMLKTGSGNDNLIMGDQDDHVETGAGNDMLNGGGGFDTLIGGIGNDTYVADGTEQITEAANGGTDTIQTAITWSLVRNLENLTLTGADNINGTGNSAANIIRGNVGNNRLNGGTGNDTLIGGAGNDTYITDGGDRITEGVDGGIDLVQSSATHTLGANIENLTLAGTAAINGTGNVLNNVLRGNAASNVLNGSTGNDTLIGGAGNDTYVTDGGDRITEAADAGIDLVQSSVNYTLGSNLENLTLTGVGAINGTGNTLNNVIRGNAAANTLNGSLGNDTMVGGAGTDTFVFNSALGVGNVDRISDFNVTDDTIRLDDAVFAGLARGTLSATGFAANAAGQAATATDRIIYETDTGRLYYDADGLGGTGRIQFGTMTAGLALTNADFFVF